MDPRKVARRREENNERENAYSRQSQQHPFYQRELLGLLGNPLIKLDLLFIFCASFYRAYYFSKYQPSELLSLMEIGAQHVVMETKQSI